MIRIRMPAIREIKGDSEMPATIEVDSGITIGQVVTVSEVNIRVAWSMRRLAAPPEEARPLLRFPEPLRKTYRLRCSICMILIESRHALPALPGWRWERPRVAAALKFKGIVPESAANSCRPPRGYSRRDRKRSRHSSEDRSTGARRACRYQPRQPPSLRRRTHSPRPRPWRQSRYVQPWRPHGLVSARRKRDRLAQSP